ncbi:MAG TPA: hypothetical protein PK695_11255 [Chitinophagaceae bacterium]|jgi:cytochrome bd-type quinol oxidase subunit 2|nr:hypothetical protein [Chitinophagaceae bacterium]OPZ15699.1 MAG: hypothetical protein BWZ05_02241 [Bacteroidetes bacterium ADurb.BinA245]HMW66709.1 hypothetical protein [Chitinophagaceae bacterium]HMX77246.1 hypothetical protein [Chitinophagaceae bacterium]HNA90640.1 hypothetical protein [Chitinophagaceae bacterium]
MNLFKRYFGLIFLVLAPFIVYELVHGALANIKAGGTKEINNPVIWVMVIIIFMPIIIGLVIFGWYAFRGEFDYIPQKSKELD